MPNSSLVSSYTSELDIWRRVLDSPRGRVIRVESPEAAIKLRQRLYGARQAIQRANLKVYPEGDPRRGTSPYDEFQIIHRRGEAQVLIRKSEQMVLEELDL